MKKRILSILLLCCMVLGLLPTTVFASNDGAKAIQLGTSGISGYDSTNNSYDYIHFGTWDNSTVKWRVLDTKTNMPNAREEDGFFLLSDALLGTGEYGGVEFDYTTPYFNDWKGSRAQDWCNDFYSRSLSITEQKAVLATSKSDALYGMYYAASDNILDGDKVFFLSAEEAENAAYGFTDDNARIANYGDSAYVWWLRSPRRMNPDSAGTVNEKGAVIGEWVGQTNAARPAFNLKPDSVLLVSAAVGGKGTADGMFKIPEYSGDEWKLTLLDDTRTFRVTETTAAGKPGGTVTLNFSGPRTGQNEYISAIIEGKNGATHYGRIMKPTAADRQLSFTLPHDLASGNYKLHVFSEQYNGDCQTDYASQFQTVALTVEEAATEQFALTPGGTYYFDLSGENIPGTINDDLPDKSMHYVPFTYAGAVDAYKLTSEMATTEEYAEKNKYLHSLFVADYAVTGAVNWNILNNASLIFGKDYAAGGVDYMLRAPSVGSDSTGSGNSRRGTPQSNEWDRILDKNDGYIKNWSSGYSWGQDTSRASSSHRGIRWNGSNHNWASGDTTYSVPALRFHPVLEVLNPDTLGADGLKAVTLDLGGGKLGGSSDRIQIIVKNGKSFTAPAFDGLTRPDGNTGSYFKWLGSDGELYEPGDNVSADVTRLTAQFALIEQFRLAPGDTYYFDLSAMGIPGTVNGALPDNTMHYVPFTYVGIVEAYNLKSAMETTEAYAKQNAYVHSMFVADYAVTHTISWKELYAKDLIFGKGYVAGGVDYTLRMPSAGSGDTGSGNSKRGTPQSNEWDRILDKNDGYIKNWSGMSSWGQDTPNIANGNRALRGHDSIRNWGSSDSSISSPDIGFRPVLEVLNLGTLDADGLKAVTLDLGGGKLGNSSEDIQIIVKNGESFTAPASDGLTRPDGDTGSSFMWLGNDGKLYEPGDNVSADVTRLTAQFDEQFTLTIGDTYWFDLSGVGIPGTANSSLPDTSLHYVPFTYAGTVDAYKLTSEMVTTEEYAQKNEYVHSLFVADYVVTHTVGWDNLDGASLIFGKGYAAGSVDYMLRAPSTGSDGTGSGNSRRGTPQSNEWDRILDKDDGYIKNCGEVLSWGQDTASTLLANRARRGYNSARNWSDWNATWSRPVIGFRPVLEVLNPDTLSSDGLKAVTLDLGGGKLGGSSEAIQIIVKNGESFTAPASDGLIRPDGDTGSYFMWFGSDGNLYAPGESISADVTKLTAQFNLPEQFTLAPGGTYYFDLSGAGIPGTANGSLPDASLHYVPFTYAGTVDAYKLTSEMATTEEYAQREKYPHSLFVADYVVTHTVSRDDLNTKSLIFGKDYVAGGVDYTLRAPSCGSGFTGSGDSECGTPQSNEWDAVLDKNSGYIQNWNKMYSWGQDTSSNELWYRAVRGYSSARYWNFYDAAFSGPRVGFRPVLEILNADTLGPDGLKVVTLDLGGGKLGGSSDAIHIIVKTGSTFTAPASDGLTRPDGNTGSYFMWLGSNGKLYAPGDNVPADVTKLTAQFALSEQFFLTPGGRYYFDLSAMNIPGTANGSLPDASLHYVPFTYVGTIEAYKLTSATATTEEYAQQNKYPHSLFVADYAVTHTISWGGLNDEGLIFGKDYVAGGVDYTLRAPSCGSGFTGSGDSECGTPQSNEWDAVLDKNSGYIQNWNKMYSWGQDTSSNELWYRAVRGYSSARYWNFYDAAFSGPRVGFRPVLEILNADTLGPDGLKVVTLDLGGGKLGGSSDAIHIIVKTGSTFTAPASDGLTRPDGDAGSFFMWLGSDGKLYDPGDNVPADVTKLTAQFASSSHSVTITTATLPDGKVGEAYSQTLIATGTTPITWSIIGALPDGLSLNKDTGKISGTPTAAGSSTFTVKATNSAGSDTKELSITITKDAPPAHEHSYGDWRKDGTSHWHECTDDDCPNREESINDKAAHVYDDDADTTCDVCGYERTVTPPSHEHSYGDWRKDGTNHWHECTDDDCPDREESIKDKAAHVYTDDADTTCDTCGYERTITPPAHEHRYGDWRKDGTNHWHECTDADCPNREESIKDKAAHVYTDDADTTCDVCGYERTVTPPSHEHSYGDWRKDGTNHWHECTDDDCPDREESIKDKAAHVYTDDADTTCDTCGYERTITPPAHEHRYGDWRKDGTNHWHECTDADCPNREESIKDKAAHVYDNDADTTCNTCGYERTVTPPAHEHIVTFDGNGGTSSVGSMTTTNQKLTSLPSASRSGSYSFDGWYTEKSGGTKITTDTVFSANTTVYAHWTYTGGGGGGYNPPVTYYTLRFETGGGSDIPSVREAYNTYIDLTKYVPTWRGHTFIGWYTERSLMNKVSGVYLTKDMTVYAGWRVNENPGTGANPFTDVSEKDWFYSDVMFVYENGLMLGTSKTLFSPHGTATRGMMATILWRMEGSPVPKGKNSFTDVEAGKWYADAITWTAENGIFAGYGKDKFGPDDPITREQLAAIFYRYADYKGYDLTVKGNLDKFKDADKITDYAKTAMQWAVGSGLVKGKSGNLLDSQGTATRAEIAAMLHRFIEKYELVQGKAPGGLMGWIDPKRLQIPKTGDNSVLGLWGFSLCTSLAGCLALTTWQTRRRREEEALQIIEK